MDNINDSPLYKRVMVIDDNLVDRYVARRNLLKYSFAEEIIEKGSANMALEFLRSLEGSGELLPQFIFLDIRMPEMDGFDFLEEYQKLSDSIKLNCVVIMLSTSLNPNDIERVKMNKYVKRFINKPLDKGKIALLLEENIES
jgi:CheY-like chemotaxis protein